MLYANETIGTVGYMGGVRAVDEVFCHAWGQLIQFSTEAICGPHQTIFFTRTNVSYHEKARNELVDAMRGDWLLQLDTDHQPEPDVLCRLLHRMDQAGVDVAAGLYTRRAWPFEPVLYKRDPSGLFSRVLGWTPGAVLTDVGLAAGGGCLLVRRTVFERITAEFGCEPFEAEGPLSEDLSFFARCEQLRIPVLIDPRIECKHLTTRPVGLEDFFRDDLEDPMSA